MGLKIATNLTITNEKGAAITGFLINGGLNVTWKVNQSRHIKFFFYSSQEEYQKNPDNYICEYNLPVTQEQIQEMMQTQGYCGLVISDKGWELADSTPFILDFADFSEVVPTQRVGKLKSVTELGGLIVDVGI